MEMNMSKFIGNPIVMGLIAVFIVLQMFNAYFAITTGMDTYNFLMSDPKYDNTWHASVFIASELLVLVFLTFSFMVFLITETTSSLIHKVKAYKK